MPEEVVPYYVICDVSRSMSDDLVKLQDALENLKNDASMDPVLDEFTLFSLITFCEAAKTVVRLARPSEVVLPQLVTVDGDRNFGAAFEEYNRTFRADLARLRTEGQYVHRPCIFFLSAGDPADRGYLETFRSLLAYNRETRTGNHAFPYVMTFGFRDAKEKIMAELAYPDFGVERGRWFVGCPNVGEIMWSLFSASAHAVSVSGRRFPDTL